jgi:hypothetical protein
MFRGMKMRIFQLGDIKFKTSRVVTCLVLALPEERFYCDQGKNPKPKE